MKKSIIARSAIATAAALGMSAAMASDPVIGPYFGGGILQSHFDSHHFDVDDIDNKDISWKAIAGVRLTPNFAVEANYAHFGEATAPSANVGGPFEAKAHAWSAFGVGLLPVGPVDFYVKAGAARIKADGNVGAVFYSDNKTEFAYGAGLQFGHGPLTVRAEYEKYDTDVIGDLDVISLGLVFAFGTK